MSGQDTTSNQNNEFLKLLNNYLITNKSFCKNILLSLYNKINSSL